MSQEELDQLTDRIRDDREKIVSDPEVARELLAIAGEPLDWDKSESEES